VTVFQLDIQRQSLVLQLLDLAAQRAQVVLEAAQPEGQKLTRSMKGNNEVELI
jgi:hypothetical protein